MKPHEPYIKRILMKNFGLSAIRLIPLSGYYDQNFKVVSERGVFFLKVYGFDMLPSIRFQLDLMRACREARFPVAKILPNRNGRLYFRMGKHYGSLQEFLPG